MLVAIITARGGSKGLPGKNIKKLCGKPMIAYSIEAALKSNIFDEVIVTTDNLNIAKTAKEYGASVMMRPERLGNDDTSSYDVVENLLSELQKIGKMPKEFMLLQPTSPLRTSNHIKSAYRKFNENKLSSLASIVETEITPFKCFVENLESNNIEPLFDWESLSLPRQKLPKTYLVNGAIYICNVKDFLGYRSFFAPPFSAYKMEQSSSIDVDTLNDFIKIENILKSEKW